MNLSTLLTVIMDTACDLVRAEGSSLLLADPESDDLIFNIVIGEKGDILKGDKVPKGMGIAGVVASTGEALIVNNAQDDSRHFKEMDQKHNYITRNILCVPMTVVGKLVGVLEVVNTVDRENFDQWDCRLLSYLADQAAIAINNRRLYDDLSIRVDELTAMYEISQSLTFIEPSENIFQKVIISIANSLNAEKASIAFYDETIDKLLLRASYGHETVVGDNIPIDMMESISGYVLKTGDPLLVTNIDNENSLLCFKCNDDYHTKSFISLPIKHKGVPIGVISLTDKRNRGNFDSFDFRVLSTIANQLANVHENLRNLKQLEGQEQLEKEIDIASEMQKKILPAIPANIKSHRLAAYNNPAKDVGGDFYDFFRIDDNKYAVLVADISGKGIPAALFMGTARNVLRAELRFNAQPGKILGNANTYIYEDSEHGMFVTLFYLLVDMHNNLITFGSAGHNDQILIKANTRDIIKLNSRGKPLGITPKSVYEERALLYDSGDLVVLFTDGILEFLGGHDIDLGERKLIEIASGYADREPADLIEHFRHMIETQPRDDDMIDDFTILAIRL